MSFLQKLEPTKQAKTFEITAYDDDMKLFMSAIDFLQSKYKGSGKYTPESLFEHLTHQLRQDQDLLSFIETKSKRRSRSSTKARFGSEKKPEIAQ